MSDAYVVNALFGFFCGISGFFIGLGFGWRNALAWALKYERKVLDENDNPALSPAHRGG